MLRAFALFAAVLALAACSPAKQEAKQNETAGEALALWREVLDAMTRQDALGFLRRRCPTPTPAAAVCRRLGAEQRALFSHLATAAPAQAQDVGDDVSAFFAQSGSKTVIAKQRQIHPAVRQFPRVGGMNGAKLRHLARHLDFRRGRTAQHAETEAQNQLWDDEWYRCFGDSRFDYVVDFSGYGPFWAILLLHSPEAQRSIWMHNDLAADAHREVNGEKRMLHSLTQLFTLYAQYDHLVSVSPTLSEVNSTSLAEYAEPAKFRSALNTVDAEHILENAAADLRELTFDDETGSIPDWAELLLAPDDDVTTFVNVGRLSPEKNQERLIRAFARVHAEDPKTRLLLVGSGPLAGHLEGVVAELGLEGSVFLTGMQRNPHAIMAKSDCFVLSSDYEGQPMVILEALVLQLPIVTVEFASAKNALPKGAGLVVPQSVDGVADGMTAYLRGDVPDSVFDWAAYNRKAVAEFYRAIGAVADVEAPTAPSAPTDQPTTTQKIA